MIESPPAKTVQNSGKASPALLHEMMRSFVALAKTLNLSRAVEDLGSTRQTVRRHIQQLEDAMEMRLFDNRDRRFELTQEGRRALVPAQLLLDLGEVWYRGQFDDVDGMMRFSYEDDKGWVYHQQEQPMNRLWAHESPLLKQAIKCWALAEGKLESKHMAPLRPYILTYRAMDEGWICFEIGAESFYSNWFGWARARSSVGSNLNQFPGGAEFASLANAPFKDINNGQGLRLDQVMTKMPSDDGEKLENIFFDRLLMGVRLPDQSPAIVSVVDRSREVLIAGLDPDQLARMPERAKVDFSSKG
ncbi:LysR family transcriptional regulator [Sulfitobacter sp. S190]|uniref:helix-turn-helix domain-containing protein n=1 Tax=Sulfitobacter sp. S190 TaxID=2867022 RepID=UPI0021A700F2|nr:LysR family transcriptional regulator [Sulfitobacter sp. S190]UWR22914.1 LysR family transcriptional regulator [Sulfitobacter sp. S190]